ncbi:hypothetical protein [Streptomyces inhibens]|nr:hypothetical protein [Streptomyces inhibens]
MVQNDGDDLAAAGHRDGPAVAGDYPQPDIGSVVGAVARPGQ